MNEKINELSVIEQNLTTLNLQRQQLQVQVSEIESALKELGKTNKAYRIIGNVMIEKDKEKLIEELKNEKELIELRLKAFKNQEENLKKNKIDDAAQFPAPNPEKSQLVGDIILFDKSLKPLSLIEITKLKPNSGDIHGGSAAARIYQLIKAVMTKYVSKGGLILPISWKSRIEQDKEFLQKFNIHIIFTSFEKRWEDIVLKRIQNYLN